VIPPGPVSERGRVELRLALPNPRDEPQSLVVEFSADGTGQRQRISRQRVTAPAHSARLARAWWATGGRAGKHLLRYRVTGGGKEATGSWPLEVVPSATPALPRLSGGWLDALALDPKVYPRNREGTAADVNITLDAMKRLGMTVAVVTYVEYQGSFFYPSAVRFYDRDVKRESGGQLFPFDVVGTVLAAADRNGMHVFLGLGRSGDTPLLWEFEKPGWEERNRQAIDTAKRVAAELWERYRRHPSFYGWYLTHEMNDLARASAYYDPVARFCHSLSPDKPVMVAPAGTPILTPELLARSEVDIFAYQDAVGSGYVPYRNTWDPEKRMAMLDEVFGRYRQLHQGTEKHLWADLEIWEMDGTRGYAGAYPPAFSRVRRQIEKEAGYVELITAYEVFGFLEPPGSAWQLADRRAARLYREYAEYAGRQ
jgi:hypothetical protein